MRRIGIVVALLAFSLPLGGLRSVAPRASANTAEFGGAFDISAGSNPHGMAFGDLNRDGIQDVVVAVRNGSAVSVLIGHGDGTFANQVQYAAGTSPQDVVIADLDRDGDLDVASANTGSDDVSILLGDGTGALVSVANYADGAGPNHIGAADFDRDGDIDLVTSDQTVGSVSVLLQSPPGVFVSRTTYPVPGGGGNYGIGIGDFTGDGKVDVATANVNFGLLVYPGDGVGGLAGATNFGGGTDNAQDVAVGDVNRDGALDVVLAFAGDNDHPHYVSVYLFNGGIPDRVDYAAPDNTLSVALGDLDGDGNLDVASLDHGGGAAVVRYGSSDGSLGEQNFLVIDGGNNGNIVRIADINGDAKPDIFATAGSLRLLLNTGTRDTIGLAGQFSYAVAGPPTDVVSADFDLNGSPDLVTTDYTSNAFSLLLNNGDGSYGASIDYDLPPGSTPFALATGDFNRDGRPDLAIAKAGANNLAIGLGDGSGGFSNGTTPTMAGPATSVTVGDLNRDGKPDLVASRGGTNIAVFLGVGDGTFTAGVTPPTDNGPRRISIGDLNRDGNPDVAVCTLSAGKIDIFLGNGVGGLSPAPTPSLSPTGCDDMAVADFDRDGALDIAAVSQIGQPRLEVFLGNGDGSFAADDTYDTGITPNKVAVGDISGDGIPDLVISGLTQNKVYVHVGAGDGSFPSHTDFGTGGNAFGVSLVDVNGDGALDLIDTDADHSAVEVRRALAVSLSASGNMFAEGDTGTTTAHVPIYINVAPLEDATVFAQTQDGTAKDPGDYTATGPTTLTFPAGSVDTVNFDIPIVGDTLDENDETFTANLSGPSKAVIGTAQATQTISDNDDPPTLSINDPTATEGGTADFVVSASVASAKTITVKGTTSDGTAGNADYAGVTNQTFTIAAGSTTSNTVAVQTTSDTTDEPNETFDMTLNTPTNATFNDGTGTATITDDDNAPSLSIDDPTVTEGGTASFTVTASNPSSTDITVKANTADGTAGSADYTAVSDYLVTIPAGTTMGNTIPVDTTQDTLDEADETVAVNLSNVSANATISDSQGVATINDNDAAPNMSIGPVSAKEGKKGALNDFSFPVTLSTASGRDLSFDYETVAGTATADVDYVSVTGTVVIPAGSLVGHVHVTVRGDKKKEKNETFSVKLSNYVGTITGDTGVGTIKNDDK